MKLKLHANRKVVVGLAVLVVVSLLLSTQAVLPTRAANQIDLVGPAGSGQFGQNVTVLPNGNIVVADPGYDAGAVADVGAVYLYNGLTGALISTLTGSVPGDKVGDQPVVVLKDGNFVVSSSQWANGGAALAGAVTWCNAMAGCAGAVSPANSLVGSSANDQVGYSWIHNPSIIPLNDGNYVVTSISWTNGSEAGAGAVTWCAAGGGCVGPVSTANSLVGSTAGDVVGRSVTVLTSGSYVVTSPTWSNGSTALVGAATWCNGGGGCNGQAVSAANSLVGSQVNDLVGGGTRLALSNGSYVVSSPFWANGTVSQTGAVTWCSGTGGCVGPVTTANSLVGSTMDDRIGYYLALQALDNGSYVVRSSYWDNGAVKGAGAVTWCSGAGSCNGKVVGSETSLVGTQTSEALGVTEIIPLANGNFLVLDQKWDSRGALTWCSGTVGCSGEVSEANSLVDPWFIDAETPAVLLSNGNYVVADLTFGSNKVMWCSGTVGCHGAITENDSLIGSPPESWYVNGISALDNGNYVIMASGWDNGATVNVGAVTWCGGSGECNGQVVSTTNSLVGVAAFDSIGTKVVALKGGAYEVISPDWNNGSEFEVGAVTLCDGLGGCNGATVTAANSLIGSTAGDQVGYDSNWQNQAYALENGGYVVRSPGWQNGATPVGAVTVCSATGSCTGQVVSAANSLVGSADHDLSDSYIAELNNGNVVFTFQYWDNGVITNAGAVTWCSKTDGCHGVVSPGNSLVGSTADDRAGIGHFSNGDGNGGIALPNGSYAVLSSYWDNGGAADAGAVTRCSGVLGTCVGDVAAANSVLGLAASGGASLRVAYDSHYNQLVVSRPADNRVTLLKASQDSQVYLPVVRR